MVDTKIVTIRGVTRELPTDQKGFVIRRGRYFNVRVDELQASDLILYAPANRTETHLDVMKRTIVELRPVLRITEAPHAG